MSGPPLWVEAGLWGLLGGSALVLGAAIAWLASPPRWATAGVMAFGCGVLISAVAYDLLLESYRETGFWPIVSGALAGSAAYAGANWLVSRHARHRKRSGDQQGAASEAGSLAIAVGALLDGVPESVVLGISLIGGEGVSLAMLAAIFLSNLPEGLSSATGMRKAGHGAGFVFGLWIGIALLSGIAAALGAGLLGGAPPALAATVSAVAAGALLTMVADTMIPEAVETDGGLTGVLVVLGLLTAFGLSQGGGG